MMIPQDSAFQPDLPDPGPRAVIARIEAEAGLERGEIYTRVRTRRISWPRQDAMLALRRRGLSLTQIGRVLAGDGPPYDHTTVGHGIKAAEERRNEDR